MLSDKLRIEAIPAFDDNYIWLLSTPDKACAIVDPGDAEPVIEVLEQRGLNLTSILLTHHHYDHTGGVKDLLKRFQPVVFGPQDDRIPQVHHVCREGERIMVPGLEAELQVLEVPAHTRSHIAFYSDRALFCGDTLFSLGCGRFFEGTASDMQVSLDKLAVLPAETEIYCAHEYTQANCRFALAVEPENKALQDRAREIDWLRANGKITLPSRLGEELACNPFLRTRENSVVESARKIDPEAAPGEETMAIIRAWKDRF